MSGSASKPSQFTVLIRAIPWSPEQSYSDTLSKFFTNYYSSSYLSHQMVYHNGIIQRLLVCILLGTVTGPFFCFVACRDLKCYSVSFLLVDLVREELSPRFSLKKLLLLSVKMIWTFGLLYVFLLLSVFILVDSFCRWCLDVMKDYLFDDYMQRLMILHRTVDIMIKSSTV